ncbi:MAG: ComEC family competence protein [Candidatus Pacebacteria bacterium]|nr:ComEC family competence protein [Candidatus Paceibacterota bacterium]
MLGKKFLMYIFSFLGGILLHSIFLNAFIGDSFLFIILGLSLLLFLFGGKYLKIIALSAVIFLLGFLRFDASINNQQKHVLDYFADEKIEIVLEGKISEKPLKQGSSNKLIIDVNSLVLGNKKESLDTKISLKTFDYQEYHYGQIVRFETTPQIPKSFEADGGRIFDYEHFLEKDGIYYVGKTRDISIVEQSQKSIFSTLYSLKNNLLKQIYRYIPKPESSLLAGVLLGEKTALGDKLEDDFRTTGLMHIVVLSGYNVSLVIMAVMIVLGFLPLYTRSVIAVLGIVAFALLVGAGPTVIRASIMALFIVLAKIVGRDYHIERTLLLAGVFMVMYNPWILYFDISFQFSFLATYGLIALMPLLEKPLSFLPRFLAFRDSAAATISAQIMVMPLIMYYIGDFSVVSVLVNMLVLFIIPITMLLGFVTAVFGFFAPVLASIIALPATLSLKYILILVEFFADVPFAKFAIPKFSFWWVIVYYLLLFFYLFKMQKNKSLEQNAIVL